MMPEPELQVIIRVDHLVKQYPLSRGFGNQRQSGYVHAVDDVSLDIYQGEILGLAGETGSGKTTLAKCMIQLTKPTSGHIYYKDKEIEGMDIADISRRMQIVTQDPMVTLNPKKTIREIVGGNLRLPGSVNQNEIKEKIEVILDQVGLNPEYINRYPNELSVGEKQRLNLARSLAYNPHFIIYDDPFSMLDMSVQSRFINVIEENRNKHGLTYFLISHDLSLHRQISSRIAIMYLGVLVEIGGKSDIFQKPLHPYTKTLFSAAPVPDPATERKRRRITIDGEIPSQIFPPSGCRFRAQCPLAGIICAEEKPELRKIAPGHLVACHMV
jgi:oligopeptide transport system ATP-binding protein